MKTFENLKIVEIAMYLPLPYAGSFFAEMGAKVIKIEQPEKGDPLKAIDSSVYKMLNERKDIVFLDLKKTKDLIDLKKIVMQADIVLNGFRRGFLEERGLGFCEVSKRNKKVIYVNLYGYPKEISLQNKAGHDLNFIGLSGIYDLLKEFKKPLPFQIADMAGALWAIIGSLIMLNKRERTKRGGELDLSLFTSILSFLPFFYFSDDTGSINKGLLYGENPFYNIYECKDGKLIAVGSLEEKFAKKLLEILKIKDEDNIFSAKTDIKEKLKRVFKSKNRSYFIKLFEKEDICVTPVLTKSEFFDFLKKNLMREEKIRSFILFPIKKGEV